MDHVAIMKASWKLLPKILSGEKTIESRWYVTKAAPWNRIKEGETVYFKEGTHVTVQATVDCVKQFEHLDHTKIKKLLNMHANNLGIPRDKLDGFCARFQNKRYCILVFLKNPQPVTPFRITKKGFGIMSAWICVDNIDRIKL